MKWYNCFFATFLFLGTACTPDQGNNQNTVNSNDTDAAVNNNPACIEGSYATAVAPGNSYFEQLLVRNWWVMEFYIDTQGPKDRLNRTQTGRWYKFEPDGTFTDGHWEEQIGYGSWRLTTREGKNYLFIDNFCSNRDGEWEVQDANNAEDAMSWNAVKGYNDDGAIVKIINLLSRPTKQQFGYQ